MPLVVGGHEVKVPAGEQLLKHLFGLDGIKTLLTAAASERESTIATDKRVVYVHQHEVALSVLPSVADVLGSQDATTCVCLVLRSAATGKACAAHFDTAQEEQLTGATSLASMLSAFDSKEAAE